MAKKIKRAKKIVLYTDSDLDGVASGLIAKKTLEELGKDYSLFFTDREKRGYGLSKKSVEMISGKAPALLITMDCGISDFEGVKKAKKNGFEVIILDHHEPHEKLPDASLIVCPKLYDDSFKERPNAGIVFELSELLLGRRDKNFIEYTALAIFGDMMPHRGPNEKILKAAIEEFPKTSAMAIFKKVLKKDKPMQIFQEAAPILNVTEMHSGVPQTFSFFLETGKRKQLAMARKMIKSYKRKKAKVEKIKNSILKNSGEEGIVFTGSKNWESFLLGKIASGIVEETGKPAFIYKIEDDIAQGSVRVPKHFDAVEAMKRSKSILENYGGHPPAAGFTVKIENLDEFKDNLINYFKSN